MRAADWFVVTALVTVAGCQDCSNNHHAGEVDALIACTTNTQCPTGEVCVAGGCALPGTVMAGGMCSATRDCATSLYCSEVGVCAPGGTGGDGAPCSSSGDCMAGLTCALAGFSGTCTMAGTKDLGQACTASTDCIAGLVCGSANTCEPPLVAYPPFTGVTCAADLTTFGAYWEVPRTGTPLADFYRLPFPNDVRVAADGTLALGDFPRPGKSLLGVDLVDLFATALQADFDGFSTIAPITFRFTSELDFDSIMGGANLHYVDITDPALAGYGADLGRSWSYDTGKHKFICQHAFVVANSANTPLAPGHTYAAYLTTAIRGKHGEVPVVGGDLTAVLGATQPTDPDLAVAWTKHTKFRDYLQRTSIAPATIAGVAVVTTAQPTTKMKALATTVRAGALPTLTDLTLCDGVNVSPCAGPGTRGACGNSAGAFWEIHGTFSEPNFQAGTLPYETVADGGAIAYDTGGNPIVQNQASVCFALTIPKTTMPAGGWPLVVHAHGTGGSFKGAIDDGIAQALATASSPSATLAFDGVGHGARAGTSTRSADSLVFNVINPRAARDNHLQGAVDVVQAVRIAQVAAFTVAGVGTIDFDAARVRFFGHSQGSNVGILGVGVTPDVQAAVFSGAGSDLTLGILNKTSPVAAKAGLELLLGEAIGGGHPMMVLWQTFFDRVDPVNYAPLIIRTPPAGVPSKHAFVTWSATDTYSPKATLTETCQVMNLLVAEPVLDAMVGTADPRPITTNRTGGDAVARLGACFQYASDGSYDGHFVSTRNPAAVADWTAFLTSLNAGAPNVP